MSTKRVEVMVLEDGNIVGTIYTRYYVGQEYKLQLTVPDGESFDDGVLVDATVTRCVGDEKDEV